jgi:hypothetical protein
LEQNRLLLSDHEAKEKELQEALSSQRQAFKEKLESQVLILTRDRSRYFIVTQSPEAGS